IRRAHEAHPDMHFAVADAHALDLDTQGFDVVVMSDLVNDVWDVELAFGQLTHLTHPGSRLVLNFYSHLWELPLGFARSLGLSKPLLDQNWLTVEDIENLLRLANFEVTRGWEEILLPVRMAGFEVFANRFLAHMWPLTQAALTHLVVARPAPRPENSPDAQ